MCRENSKFRNKLRARLGAKVTVCFGTNLPEKPTAPEFPLQCAGQASLPSGAVVNETIFDIGKVRPQQLAVRLLRGSNLVLRSLWGII